MPIETEPQLLPFSKHARLFLALAAVVTGLLLAVPAADAATYCVGSPSECSGVNKPGDGAGLQEAFDEASANGESDMVQIGVGTYIPPEPGGFEVVSPANSIVIGGSGSDATILEGRGPSAVTLNLTGSGLDSSNVRNVALRLSDDGGTPIGLSAGSSDPDHGDALTYAWTFGDGAAGTGATASHAYGAPARTPSRSWSPTRPAGRPPSRTRSRSSRAPWWTAEAPRTRQRASLRSSAA